MNAVCVQDYDEEGEDGGRRGGFEGAGPAVEDGVGGGADWGVGGDGEGDGYVPGGPPRMAFECKMDNVKTLAVVLSALFVPKKEQHAFFTATEDGAWIQMFESVCAWRAGGSSKSTHSAPCQCAWCPCAL